jgi:thiol-disulfide isomerase/thioredoxin
MNFDTPYIYYLETSDFTPQHTLSQLVHPISGAPICGETVIVMIQGNFCGYCTKFKPVFQSLATQMSSPGQLDFATIQTDGSELGERGFNPALIQAIIGQPLDGVPTLVKLKKGQAPQVYKGKMDANSVSRWISR